MRRIHAFTLPALVLGGMAWCSAAWPQHSAVTDRMLASVVFVECDVEFQGERMFGGSGTGFLIAGSDHVVTNNHVITACNQDNRIEVLRKAVVEALVAELKKGNLPNQMRDELAAHPEMVERLKTDEDYRKRYVTAAVEKIATSTSKAGAPSITQKLYVVVLGKSSKGPVRFDVTRIVWNSETSNEKAGTSGVDLAILKLDRPIPGGLAVTIHRR